jgi:hypothetical protein
MARYQALKSAKAERRAIDTEHWAGIAARACSSALRALSSRELILALVGFAILLRVAQYVSNRSLWIDEADLALNLRSRSFAELLKPLDFGQGAPPGFLLLEKAVATAAGYSEPALRLVPLLAGIIAVVAFAWVARQTLSAAAAPLAVLFFAVADGLIYFSSELKPYAVDVAASVLLILGATKLFTTHTGAIFVSLSSLVLVAFSFPAAFFVAAIALVFSVGATLRWHRVPRSTTVAALSVWAAAAAAIAVFAATRLDAIRTAGGERFLGVGGSSSLLHAANVFGTNIVTALGFVTTPPFHHLQKLAFVCLIAGIISMARRAVDLLLVLLIPFLLTFIASAAHAYPLSTRTELFLVPPVILLITEGVAQLGRTSPRWRPAAAVLLAAALVVGPGYLAIQRLAHPRQREEIRPVLEFVRDHWKAGDTLYLHPGAQYAFAYYSECGCLRLTRDGHALWPIQLLRGADFRAPALESKTPALIVGHPHATRERWETDLMKLRGRGRVWFVYSHFADAFEEEFIRRDLIGELEELGVRLDGIDRPRAHAYLYRL